MRIMGIDYGQSRIGIAVSDPLGITAQGIESIDTKCGIDSVLQRIKTLIQEFLVEAIVVGFPLNMNGTIGKSAENAAAFMEILERSFDIPVIKWDERLSTVAANRIMTETNVKKAKKRSIVDKLAATYILQGYLDFAGNMGVGSAYPLTE